MRVVIRASADAEITTGLLHYLSQAGDKVAAGFLDNVKAGLAHIEAFPKSGSARYGALFPEIELRFWRIRTYPYLIFYVVREDYVDVIALLHAHADIPRILEETEVE
jgi:toxin ParE1/3/4